MPELKAQAREVWRLSLPAILTQITTIAMQYIDSAMVGALATQVLRIALLAEPLYGVSIVAAGALRGTGDTFVPSIMNLCSIWLVRLGLALVLVPRLGLRGMWIAMAVELCMRGLLMLVRQLTTKYYEQYKKEPV